MVVKNMTIEIRNVKKRKDGIKYLIIPKNSKIESGKNVLVTDNLKLINKFEKEEKNDKRRN